MLSQVYSRRVHEQLIADGVLDVGECADPEDLSELASVVFAKTGLQRDVVDRLPRNDFKYARANEGYLLAAALVREGSIRVVATLNYDLALTDAVRQLDGNEIEEISGPGDLRYLGGKAIIYLHRNVNESNYENWILRKEALENEWRGGWEAFVSQWLTMSPVVLFVGLGSPAVVLTETLKKVHGAFPDQLEAFLVDPVEESPFAESLDLQPARCIRATWGLFMSLLAERVVDSWKQEMIQTCSELCLENGWTDTDEGIAAVCNAFLTGGLLKVGQRRATLLNSGSYAPDSEATRILIADLLLAVGVLAVAASAEVAFNADGDAVLRLSNGRDVTVVLLSGSGYRRWGQVNGLLTNRRASRPDLVVAGGFSGTPPVDLAPPDDVVSDEPTDDVAVGGMTLRIMAIDDLRSQLSNVVGEFV